MSSGAPFPGTASQSVAGEALGSLPAPRRQQQQPRPGGMVGLTLPEEAAALPAPPQKRLHF